MKPKLTIQSLTTEASPFADRESAHREPSLFGVTDGKAIGTYFEHKFRDHLKILDNQGNKDDLLAFIQERMLPVDDVEAGNLAEERLKTRPEIGYLTISNALQWRLQ